MLRKAVAGPPSNGVAGVSLRRYTRCGTHGRAPSGASRAATVGMRDGGRAKSVGKGLAHSPGALGAPSERGLCSGRAATRWRRGGLKRKREARLRAGDENRGGVNICANTQRAKTASSAAVAAASAAGVHAVSSSGIDLSNAK